MPNDEYLDYISFLNRLTRTYQAYTPSLWNYGLGFEVVNPPWAFMAADSTPVREETIMHEKPEDTAVIQDVVDLEDNTEELEDDKLCCDRCKEEMEEGDEVNTKVRFWDYSISVTEMIVWNTLCESCADNHTFVCGDCGGMFHSNSQRDVDGGVVCDECSADYSECDHCGSLSRDHLYHEDNGCYYCERHMPRESKLIRGYEYKPTPAFFGKRNTTLFFGTELEINVSGDEVSAAERVLGCLNSDGKTHVYLKRDGSLSTGFEIVTHPHSFDSAVKLWKRFKAPANSSSHNGGECGMHVHVSRKYFTALHLQKLIVFINAPENTEFIKFISQRDPARWAKIQEKKIGHALENSGDRYEAINITNRATIEFRIFRGNILVERILKNLEFVKASIEWTKDRSYRELTATQFKKYLAKNKSAYPNLHAFVFTESAASLVSNNDRSMAVGSTANQTPPVAASDQDYDDDVEYGDDDDIDF